MSPPCTSCHGPSPRSADRLINRPTQGASHASIVSALDLACTLSRTLPQVKQRTGMIMAARCCCKPGSPLLRRRIYAPCDDLSIEGGLYESMVCVWVCMCVGAVHQSKPKANGQSTQASTVTRSSATVSLPYTVHHGHGVSAIYRRQATRKPVLAPCSASLLSRPPHLTSTMMQQPSGVISIKAAPTLCHNPRLLISIKTHVFSQHRQPSTAGALAVRSTNHSRASRGGNRQRAAHTTYIP